MMKGRPADMPLPPGPKNMKEWYLLSYDQVMVLGWFWILFLVVSEMYLHDGEYKTVFEVVWPALSYVQTAALCEIAHSLLGWTNTPLKIQCLEVGSRLFITWGVIYLVPQIQQHWAVSTMLLAWSIAEVVRFIYYSIKLSSGTLGALSWLRYNIFFSGIYVMGLLSECILIFKALYYASDIHPLYMTGLLFALLCYIPGFPMLYYHMASLRQKHLNNKKEEEKEENTVKEETKPEPSKKDRRKNRK